MEIIYKEEIAAVDFGELNALLREIFGAEKAKDELHTRTVFEKSQYFEFAFADGKLVGAVRAISDGEWAVIYNFGVRDAYRGTDVETEVLARLVRQLKGQHIFTNALPGTVQFYEKNGFQRTKTAFTYVGFAQGAEEYPDGYFLPENYRFENEFREVGLPFAGHHVPEKKRDVQLSYRTDRKDIDYARVNEVIALAFAGGRELPPEALSTEKIARTKQLFDMSEYVSFAYDGSTLIGVARAITDGLEEAYIQNVAVDPAYQGYGIGWQVVVNLSEDIRRNGLNPFLHTHPGAVGFYNRKGFRRNKTAVDYKEVGGNLPPMPPEAEQGFYLPVGYRFADEFC